MSEKFPQRARELMKERFGKDSLIAIATVSGGLPQVRTVDGFYEDGAFYSVTHSLSRKMKQIAENPNVAICGEWFTGRGTGENLGHVLAPENAEIMEKLRAAFANWYGCGHVDESDPNTCVLRVKLAEGELVDEGTKYAIDFSAD